MIKDRKHPDPETLLKHVLSDDNISHNVSGEKDFDTQSSKKSDIGTLNADITEMEKIKSVGMYKFYTLIACSITALAPIHPMG